MKNDIKGTLILTKSNLKRDKFRLSVWLICLTILSFALIGAYSTMMSDNALQEVIIMRATNPAIRMLDSPSPGLSLGGFYTARGSVLITILIIAMTIQTMNKHTRENEESGVFDLVASTMVGKYAPLLSAVIISIMANIVIVLATTIALYSFELDLLYSFYTGLSFALMGLFMTGVMAIAVQVSSTTSEAAKIGWLSTLFFFTISAIGNLLGTFNPETFVVTSNNITYLSPFGWYQQMAIFHENNMYLIIPFIISFIVLMAVAFKLTKKRDIGHGLIPAKKGRKDAKESLLSTYGLYKRLGRRSFLTWFISIVFFGLLFGYVSEEFEKGLAEIEGLQFIFGDISSTDYFLALIISIVSICLLIFYVLSILRLRKEEVNGTLENVLSSAVTRKKVLLTKVLDSTIDLFIIYIFLAISIYLGAQLVSSDVSMMALLESSMNNFLAIIVIGSIVVMALGLLPRASTLIAYGLMLISIGLGPIFGPMFNVDEKVLNISVFTHLPTLLDEKNIMMYVTFGLIIIISLIIGTKSYQKRNLELK